MKSERIKRLIDKEIMNDNREDILIREIEKSNIKDYVIFDDCSFIHDNKKYYSKYIFGRRYVNPFNYSFNMIKRNGQFAFTNMENFLTSEDMFRDGDFEEYKKIANTCNDILVDFIFSINDHDIFPKYLKETEDFYIFEHIEPDITVVESLRIDELNTLELLYGVYKIYGDAKILPGNELDDYVIKDNKIYFINIENIVYNYFKTFRYFLHELTEDEFEGTYKYDMIDFRNSKTTENFREGVKIIRERNGG